MTRTHWTKASLALVSAAAAAVVVGCGPQQAQAPRATISDKVYTVSPDAMTVKAGIVSGEVSGMRVVERVEEGSGRVDVPARLSAKLVLKNVSRDQSVRIVGGKISFFDPQGKRIVLEDNRGEAALKLTSYGSDRLDPGQDASHSLEVEFPVEALKAKRLRNIEIGLVYVPSPYKEEALSFPVSIGGQ
jgi:hypothetical protein